VNPIFQALEEGYSAEDVIGYISKAIPKMAPAIKKATSSGYTLQQVLGYISKVMTPQESTGLSESQIHEKNRRADSQMVKHGLAMIASAAAAPAVASGLKSALSRALPNPLKSGLNPTSLPGGHTSPLPLQQTSPSPVSTGTNISPPSPGNVPASAPMQQTGQSQNQLSNPLSTQLPPGQGDSISQIEQKPQIELFGNAKKYLESLGILDTVKERLSRGNTPEAVAASLNIKRSGEAKVDKELLKNIEEYAQNIPESTKENENQQQKVPDLGGMAKGISDNLYSGLFESLKKGSTKFAGIEDPILKRAKEPFEKGLIKNAEDLRKFANEKPSIEKTSIVSTPQGIGEVKEIRNGKALVAVNGKIHKVDEQDLEQEPEEIRTLDLDSAVEDYLSRIPESQKSSVIDVSLYDPENQELQVRFPNGDQWVYGPIPEEIFEKINSMTGIPVSSGESKLRGTIWEKGVENSAGADFYKLIKKMVREGKVKERKLKTGIDLFKGFTRVKKRK